MKNKQVLLLLWAVFLLNLTNAFSQAPQAVPFQAVARTSSGNLLTNKAVSLRFSIHDATATGTIVYRETQTATTDGFGLFTVKVGTGTAVTGTFNSIAWGTGNKFLQVEIDPAGGSTYSDMGTQQMLSVPYALYAEKAGSAPGSSGGSASFGDGSGGALNITANTDWTVSPPASLNLQYTDITVSAGVTFTVPSGLTLRATGNVTISGTINVAPGAANNVGQPNPGVSVATPTFPAAGIGVGNSVAALSLLRPISFGGSAGARSANTTGSEGGGALRILAKGNIVITVGGSISANGRNSVNPMTPGLGILGGGGGGGGVVVLLAKGSLAMAGTIAANGGNGSNGFDGNGGNGEGGGAGGGGGIIIYISSGNTISGTSSVQGGTGAANALAGNNSATSAGGGGGASGGNGGTGGSQTYSSSAGFGANIIPTAGATGLVLQIASASPETFLN